MWIGTYYGLNRFDGIDFTIYQNQLADYNSLPHNLVFCIYEDQNRELWIGTARGLSKFDWGNDNFLNCMSDSNSALNGTECNVLSIAQDSLNRFYLGTNIGLILYDPEKQAKISKLRPRKYNRITLIYDFKINDDEKIIGDN